MKLSKENVENLSNSYRQDIDAFGDDEIYTPKYISLCVTTLKEIQQKVLEDKNNSLSSLKKFSETLDQEKKIILEDFLTYVKHTD
jgi:hypothetical protein